MAEPRTDKSRRNKTPAKSSTGTSKSAAVTKPGSASRSKTPAAGKRQPVKLQPGKPKATGISPQSTPRPPQTVGQAGKIQRPGTARAGTAVAQKAAPKAPDAKRPKQTAPKSDLIGMAAELRTLRAERARLGAELEAAQTRIAELEAARVDAINRIDWVIDSLQSLAGKNAE